MFHFWRTFKTHLVFVLIGKVCGYCSFDVIWNRIPRFIWTDYLQSTKNGVQMWNRFWGNRLKTRLKGLFSIPNSYQFYINCRFFKWGCVWVLPLHRITFHSTRSYFMNNFHLLNQPIIENLIPDVWMDLSWR